LVWQRALNQFWEYYFGNAFISASTGQESTELKKGQLLNKLRHTVDPGAISTLVEELHQLEKGRRHSEVV